jgi:hypothetical protein
MRLIENKISPNSIKPLHGYFEHGRAQPFMAQSKSTQKSPAFFILFL